MLRAMHEGSDDPFSREFSPMQLARSIADVLKNQYRIENLEPHSPLIMGDTFQATFYAPNLDISLLCMAVGDDIEVALFDGKYKIREELPIELQVLHNIGQSMQDYFDEEFHEEDIISYLIDHPTNCRGQKIHIMSDLKKGETTSEFHKVILCYVAGKRYVVKTGSNPTVESNEDCIAQAVALARFRQDFCQKQQDGCFVPDVAVPLVALHGRMIFEYILGEPEQYHGYVDDSILLPPGVRFQDTNIEVITDPKGERHLIDLVDCDERELPSAIEAIRIRIRLRDYLL
jgi:hypothetical protein